MSSHLAPWSGEEHAAPPRWNSIGSGDKRRARLAPETHRIRVVSLSTAGAWSLRAHRAWARGMAARMLAAMPQSTRVPTPSIREALVPFLAAAAIAVAQLGLSAADTSLRPGYAASPTSAAVQENAAAGVRPPLSTSYDGPTSCAEPGFLTGDTVGDSNPLAVYRALCPVTP